jgi:integrase
MARGPLPLGAWGSIHSQRLGAGSWQARTRFRDLDGKIRHVEARGLSSASARRNLQQKLVDRKTPRDGLVNSRDRIKQLTSVFLVELESSDKASRTKDKYTYSVNKYILPALGEVRINEATSGVIDRFIRGVVEDVGPSTARTCGAILSWMFKVALRHDAVTMNPVIGISIPRMKKAKPKALDVEQYQDLRAKIIAWEREPALGRPRTQELHEIADFLISTGVRPGELFALRWNDLDFTVNPPTVFIDATVIRMRTGGVRIQDHPKSQHGTRHLAMPAFLVEQLLVRRDRQLKSGVSNPINLVFPSSTGTLLDPNNIGKLWRKAADWAGYEWVTLKTFRKANATSIARTMGPEAAAYQAGHSKISMIQEHYIEELHEALDTRSVTDAFKPKDGPHQARPAADEAQNQEAAEPSADPQNTTQQDEK